MPMRETEFYCPVFGIMSMRELHDMIPNVRSGYAPNTWRCDKCEREWKHGTPPGCLDCIRTWRYIDDRQHRKP